MNDENKNQTEQHDDEHDEFEDSFEDAFGMDEATEQDPLSIEDIDAQEKEAQDAAAIERPAKKSASPLPALIILGVLGFLGWKLYGTFFTKKAEPAPENVPVHTPPPVAVAPAPPPTLPQSTTSTLPQVPSELTATAKANEEAAKEASNQIGTLQSKLTEQNKNFDQKIQTLESEIAQTKQIAQDASQSLNQLQQNMQTLMNSMQQLTNQVTRVQQDQERDEIRQQQAQQKPKSSHKSHGSAERFPSLTVYAIIPGRAWLRSANGKTITVTEGDPIGEYGKVLKIDASSGVVITTSGEILR